MDIGAPHFTYLWPPAMEAVTEIDKAPEGHKREENGLFQADAMSPVRLLEGRPRGRGRPAPDWPWARKTDPLQ